MVDLENKDYVVILQCDIVKEHCSGHDCEEAFHKRTGGFTSYPKDRPYRTLYMTCGGCCGLATRRKLTNLAQRLQKREGIDRDRVVVQLSSCMTLDSSHGPPCPHLDYLRTLIRRSRIDFLEDTVIAEKSETLRSEGVYQSRPETTPPDAQT